MPPLTLHISNADRGMGSYHDLIYEIVDQVHNLIPCKKNKKIG